METTKLERLWDFWEAHQAHDKAVMRLALRNSPSWTTVGELLKLYTRIVGLMAKGSFPLEKGEDDCLASAVAAWQAGTEEEDDKRLSKILGRGISKLEDERLRSGLKFKRGRRTKDGTSKRFEIGVDKGNCHALFRELGQFPEVVLRGLDRDAAEGRRKMAEEVEKDREPQVVVSSVQMGAPQGIAPTALETGIGESQWVAPSVQMGGQPHWNQGPIALPTPSGLTDGSQYSVEAAPDFVPAMHWDAPFSVPRSMEPGNLGPPTLIDPSFFEGERENFFLTDTAMDGFEAMEVDWESPSTVPFDMQTAVPPTGEEWPVWDGVWRDESGMAYGGTR